MCAIHDINYSLFMRADKFFLNINEDINICGSAKTSNFDAGLITTPEISFSLLQQQLQNAVRMCNFAPAYKNNNTIRIKNEK